LKDHPLVADVRGGVGLLAAVAFRPELLEQDPALPSKAYKAIRPHGVLLRPLGREVAVSPPLIITVEEIAMIAGAIRAGLDDLAETVESVRVQAAVR
jgi:adenosylmethionine-8-amino-7-oxononanoate aminotransferase